MVDWRRGGWTGSINRLVEREVSELQSTNLAAQRARHSPFHRFLRRFFKPSTFGSFITCYAIVNLIMLLVEGLLAGSASDQLPSLTIPASEYKSTLLNVTSYLIGAQVGALGAISLALALITLIAQRENSSTDVRVYYHESFAFEVVASCIALLVVLCVQLLWPLHFLLHRFGFGTDHQFFKLFLLGIHLLWLTINLAALAHFIAITFNFVHQSEREKMRERYTSNVVQPRDLTKRLRETLYMAASEIIESSDDDIRPKIFFGTSFGAPQIIEVETTFRKPVALFDVRVRWINWALRRWQKRCSHITPASPAGLTTQAPLIWFTPHLDEPLSGRISWCRRRGGVEFSTLEKIAIRNSFRFRRISDET